MLSTDKSHDKDSLKSKYFSDGFVQNVSIHELPTCKYLCLRCHCCVSLTVKKILHCLGVYESQVQNANAKQDLGKPVVMLLLFCLSSKTSSTKGYQ